METISKQKYIFAGLFLMANKIQVIGDRIFSGEMTIRQWLLTAAVAQLGEPPPTIGETARFMESSHQNVKQLALKLQGKGYLRMEKDGKDFRATRLRLTEKYCCFWEKRHQEVRRLLNEVFCDLGESELDVLYECFNKLHKIIKNI